ncbi:wnt inhibitory factor 1-like [Lytechinus pictus]|uniref:wnt inhibitory factor 1-like n=1 Tax=Lytechinus pictus TaxID=7653 RepID=UPI0030B9D5C3
MGSILVFLCSLTIVLGADPAQPNNDVDVWIDPVQARALLCRGATLDIIHAGQAQPIIQKLRSELTVIPSDINTVNITWRAAPGFHYSIHARTANTRIMENIAITIPPSGTIPTTESVFQVKLRCTGRQAGIASGRFVFKIWDGNKRHISASPLKIPFQKQCEKIVKPCHPPCSNGAVCADDGVCECPEGYYGTSCKHAICIPHCFNGGSCIEPNVCQCQDGFTGNRCQTATCHDNCSDNGQCVAPNTCVCRHGWTGPTCAIRQLGVDGI